MPAFEQRGIPVFDELENTRNTMTETAEPETTPETGATGDAWDQLDVIVEAADPDVAHEFLRELPPGETARLVAQLSDAEQQEFITLLHDTDAASLMESLPELQAAQLLAALPAEQAAHIFDEIESDEQVDLLDQMTDEQSEAILEEMDPDEAQNVRFLAQYDSDCAGGLMITEFLAFKESATVDDVLKDLRRNAEQYAEYNVQYIYVLSRDKQLIGVLRLRDLLLAPPTKTIARLMIESPISVPDSTTLEDLQHIFDGRPLFGLPVVDAAGALVGVVRRSDIEEAGEEQAGRTFLRFAGILGGEELRSLPLKTRCARRLSWLSINIVLNVVAASVISMYEETLSAVIALAVFLPMVSDMSGCGGSQAGAVKGAQCGAALSTSAGGAIAAHSLNRCWPGNLAHGFRPTWPGARSPCGKWCNRCAASGKSTLRNLTMRE